MNANPQNTLGQVLRSIRKFDRLTLDELSRRCGVSKSMLSQIEASKTNPTITMVWKIAQGLNRSIQDILEGKIENHSNQIDSGKNSEKISVPRFIHTPADSYYPLEADKPGIHFSVLTPIEMESDLEVYLITLDPGSKLLSTPHLPGTQELATVLEGSVGFQSGEKYEKCELGDFTVYPGDREHSIQNLGQSPAKIHLVVRFRYPKHPRKKTT